MKHKPYLADVLGSYVQRSTYSTGQLQRLSGIPKRTIANWLEGRVEKPRQWADLVKLAAVLDLSSAEVTDLLQTAGHPSLAELLTLTHDAEMKALLAPWAEEAAAREPAPFQAIADLPYFVGRTEVIEDIKAALLNGRPTRMCSIQGMGGVGKTALVAHLAYLLQPHFPDGVLWARIDNTDVMAILSAFAAAYGSDVTQYKDVNSRSQVVRGLLAHKRALIVLDSVQRSQEIRSLLPPTGQCAVLMTTRHHNLAAVSGAYRLVLEPFNEAESLALFTRLLGAKQVERERESLAEIARSLGYLPLAISIVASRLAYEPGWTAARFLQRLRQERQGVGELAYEEQDVRLSFNFSYETLTAVQQAFLAALSVFGGDGFDVAAAAAVTACPLEAAHDHLRKLYSLSLVQQERPQRYHLHPLLRAYAQEKLTDEGAYERMVAYFVSYAALHEHNLLAVEKESGNIAAALHVALERKMDAALVRGIGAFFCYLEHYRLYTQAEPYLHYAHNVVRRKAEDEHLAKILHHLGVVQLDKYENYDRATILFEQGLEQARRREDGEGIIYLLLGLGLTAERQGNLVQADTHYHEGLRAAKPLKYHAQRATFLCHLGRMALMRGDYRQAEEYFHKELALARRQNLGERCVSSLINLGTTAERQGDDKAAEARYQEALALTEETPHTPFISFLYHKLGRVALKKNEYTQAKGHYQEGLALAQKINDQDKMSLLLAGLGIVSEATGETRQAERYLKEALTLARELDYRLYIQMTIAELYLKQQRLNMAEQAFDKIHVAAQKSDFKEYIAVALYGLARTAAYREQVGEADRLGQQSLTVFAAIGHRRTAEVEAWLAQRKHP